MRNGIAGAILLAVLLGAGPGGRVGGTGRAEADPGSVGRSTDAVAKEREDEFNELRKKATYDAPAKRLAILTSMQFAPCPTTQRFLLGLLKKPSTPGDERLYALDSLVKTADAGALEEMLAILLREKDATLWQAFGEALGDRLSTPVREWFLGPALDAKQPETLCACLEGIARGREAVAAARAARVATIFSKSAAAPGRVDVAYRALQALAQMTGSDAGLVRGALLEAARSPSLPLRLVAAEALPRREPFDEETEAAVRALLQDESAMVQQTAVIESGIRKRQGLVAALIPMLAAPRGRTRQVVAAALAQITGQSLGYDPKAWAAWIETKTPGTAPTIPFPRYHEMPVVSDRVVFLVDASSSMLWPETKATHRIDVARAELAAVLPTLPPDTLFNVLVFAEKVASWKKEEAPATPENVAAATKWAEKAMAAPAGETHLYEVLDAAYANDPQFDTIYLLTDGNPTAGKYWSKAGLLASVRAWTRYRRTAIHTIGLSLADEDRGRPNLAEDLPLMATILRSLSDATHGEFREILKAP